jgi:hypothetical protein
MEPDLVLPSQPTRGEGVARWRSGVTWWCWSPSALAQAYGAVTTTSMVGCGVGREAAYVEDVLPFTSWRSGLGHDCGQLAGDM